MTLDSHSDTLDKVPLVDCDAHFTEHTAGAPSRILGS